MVSAGERAVLRIPPPPAPGELFVFKKKGSTQDSENR